MKNQHPLKITLASHQDLQDELNVHSLSPAASLQTLCSQICQEAQEQDIATVEIEIHSDMIPVSYHRVPAMFARSLSTRCFYPHLQSFLRGGFMVFHAGEDRAPTTFKRTVVDHIRAHGYYKVVRTSPTLPRSYRQRPGLVATFIRQETGFEIATIAKPAFLKWKKISRK